MFPGGKVDAEDSDAAWAELAPQAPTAPDRSFFVAAGRETFEEAGLVLARRRGTQEMVDADGAHRLVETYRAALLKGDTTFVDIVRKENLALAADLMVPFAHWITPEAVPKRFDTHFFLITAPMVQLGAHDGGESVEGLWITPQQALREAEAGTRTLVFATRMNLEKLARYRTVAEAVDGDALEAGGDRHSEDPAQRQRAQAPDSRRSRLRRDRGVRRGRLQTRDRGASRVAVMPARVAGIHQTTAGVS